MSATVVLLPMSAHAADGLPPVIMENKLAIAILIFLYLLPGWIAWNRKHPSKGAIILIDIVFGWTAIGWIIALIWSLGSTKQVVVIANPLSAPNPAPTAQNASTVNPAASKTIVERISDLKAMLDAGTISQTEFDLLKADTLKSIS